MRIAQWYVAVVAAGVLAGSGVEASHLVRGKLETLLAGGLRFDACQNTMARQKIALKDLIEGATPVPSGAVRVMELQEAGYAYIKP